MNMTPVRTPRAAQPLFAALADPMRRSLIANLAKKSPKTATQLATEYPITRQGILKHLTILQKAGLVRVSQAGRDKRYFLQPEPLSEVERWVDEIGALWDRRLLRLKTLVEREEEQR